MRRAEAPAFAARRRKLAEILAAEPRAGRRRALRRWRPRKAMRQQPAGSRSSAPWPAGRLSRTRRNRRCSASVTGFARVARVNSQGKDHAAVIAESLAAVGLVHALRGGISGLDRLDIVRTSKIEGRRQAGIAWIAPIGDRAGREPDLEARQIAARRNEPRLMLRAWRPIGREGVGGKRGQSEPKRGGRAQFPWPRRAAS